VVRPGGRTATSQRDAFERRRAAHYARMFRETAKRIGQWAGREKLDVLFVAGSNDAVEPVWSDMPDKMPEHATRLKGDYARLSAPALQERLAPEIEQWKRAQETAMVADIIATRNRKRAVMGIDETLRAIQQGTARLVIVVRGVRGRVRRVSAMRLDGSPRRSCLCDLRRGTEDDDAAGGLARAHPESRRAHGSRRRQRSQEAKDGRRNGGMADGMSQPANAHDSPQEEHE
jgi:hypothetical protein